MCIGVALTLTIGQLISQIFVEEFTIQFLNLYGCEFCIRLSLGAEYIGICHFSWLLYFMVSRLACGSVLKIQKNMNSQQSKDDLVCPESPTAKNRGPDFDNGVAKVKSSYHASILPHDIDMSKYYSPQSLHLLYFMLFHVCVYDRVFLRLTI